MLLFSSVIFYRRGGDKYYVYISIYKAHTGREGAVFKYYGGVCFNKKQIRKKKKHQNNFVLK